jgi:hypothetical protein
VDSGAAGAIARFEVGALLDQPFDGRDITLMRGKVQAGIAGDLTGAGRRLRVGDAHGRQQRQHETGGNQHEALDHRHQCRFAWTR